MRRFWIISLLALSLSTTGHGPAAHAQVRGGTAPHLEWEVQHRFRLFRSEADFQRHAAAMREDGILGAERRLAARPTAAAGRAT